MNALTLAAAPWLDRIVDDGLDKEKWLGAREFKIGASDAAGFAKIESAGRYTAALLSPSSFRGNELTQNGHDWEPGMLAYAGIPGNTALLHSPSEPGYVATPDGIEDLGNGTCRLAECKVKHNKIVTGPTLAEWRQLAWQFLVVPEAIETVFIWSHLVGGPGAWKLRPDSPQSITIGRDDPLIVKHTEHMRPIAAAVLAGLNAARQIQEEFRDQHQ